FGVARERQGEGVKRVAGGVKELAGTHIECGGTIGGGWPRVEFVRETGGNGERSAEAIIDGHTEEMFALTEAVNDALKILIAGAAGKRFETFLDALCERGGAAREVSAEIAALCADLVGGIEKGDTKNAEGEW